MDGGADITASQRAIPQEASVGRAVEAVRARVRASLLELDERATPPPRRCVVVLHAGQLQRDLMVAALVDAHIEAYPAESTLTAAVMIRRHDPAVIVAHWHLSREETARHFLDGLARRRRAIVVSAEDVPQLRERLARVARTLRADFAETPYTPETLDAFVASVVLALDCPTP